MRKKPVGYRPILGISNAKTIKGEKLGWITGICYLSPADESGVMDTCRSASPECKELCLRKSGRMPMNVATRIAKTMLLVTNRELFLECLRYDIEKLVRKARKAGMRACVRINGTSDLAWIALLMAAEYPQVKFYDYTKHVKAEQRVRKNYHLTFSYSGHNLEEALRVLALGINVSVVFNVKRGEKLPATWRGYRVSDGDRHDLRFLDRKGVVVGLRAKGVARGKTCAFVVDPRPAPALVQIMPMAAAA